MRVLGIQLIQQQSYSRVVLVPLLCPCCCSHVKKIKCQSFHILGSTLAPTPHPQWLLFLMTHPLSPLKEGALMPYRAVNPRKE